MRAQTRACVLFVVIMEYMDSPKDTERCSTLYKIFTTTIY